MKKVKNGEIPELTKSSFDGFVKEGIVVIDFFAEWCMPCMMMSPIIEELSHKFERKIKFGKVNVGEDEQELVQKYKVSSIPNFTIFKNGKMIEQFIGSISEDEFEEKLNGLL